MPTVAQINLAQTAYPYIKIIDITGELDESNLDEFEKVLQPIVEDESNKRIILKLDGLEFMSSKIIGYLASIHNGLEGTDRQMIFTGCNNTIRDILSVVGLDQMIPCIPTVEKVIEMIQPQS